MTALLQTVVFELGEDKGTARVKEITKFDGDASVTIRKGDKKFAVFDLSVTCAWEVELNRGETEDTRATVKGEIKLTEFSSLNDEDEYEFNVTCCEGDKDAKEKCKKKIAQQVAKKFQPHLATFAKELAEM